MRYLHDDPTYSKCHNPLGIQDASGMTAAQFPVNRFQEPVFDPARNATLYPVQRADGLSTEDKPTQDLTKQLTVGAPASATVSATAKAEA